MMEKKIRALLLMFVTSQKENPQMEKETLQIYFLEAKLLETTNT